MARYDSQSVSIGGNVARRNPIRMNLDAFAQAVNKIDERREKALQQRNAIKATIGNLKLNEAEDKWKSDYIQNIEDRIASSAMFGDMSQTYETAVNVAGDVASDPALKGRVEANEKREKELTVINQRNDLDPLTKQRWEDENKYYYEDKKDENGKIIGGSVWTPKFNPVADINIPQYEALAASMVAERSGGSSSQKTRQTLLDKEGNVTTDFNKADDVKLTKTTGGGSTYHKKQETELIDTWNRLIAQDSNLTVALKQKYDTYIWAVNREREKSNNPELSPEERATAKANADFYESKLKDKNGFVYTDVDAWSKATIIPQFKHMAYNNVQSNSVNSETFNESFFANKRANAANIALAEKLGFVGEDVAVLGSPITVKLIDNFKPSSIEEFKSLFTTDNTQLTDYIKR